MTIITSTPLTLSEALDARVAQAAARLDNHFLTVDPRDVGYWEDVVSFKEDLVGATFAQKNNVLLHHQLAKQILSSS